MPPRPTATAAVVHDARNTLTATRGRLQLLRRRTERGDVDCACFVRDLEGVEECLGALGALIDRLDAGGHPVPLAPAETLARAARR